MTDCIHSNMSSFFWNFYRSWWENWCTLRASYTVQKKSWRLCVDIWTTSFSESWRRIREFSVSAICNQFIMTYYYLNFSAVNQQLCVINTLFVESVINLMFVDYTTSYDVPILCCYERHDEVVMGSYWSCVVSASDTSQVGSRARVSDSQTKRRAQCWKFRTQRMKIRVFS